MQDYKRTVRSYDPMECGQEITSGIFLGNWHCLTDRFLENNGIKHILSITEYPPNLDLLCWIGNHMQIYIDDEGISLAKGIEFEEFLRMAMQFIEHADLTHEPILIHCLCGQNRSSSFLIAYLMKTRGMTWQDAEDMVRRKRSIIQPSSVLKRKILLYNP